MIVNRSPWELSGALLRGIFADSLDALEGDPPPPRPCCDPGCPGCLCPAPPIEDDDA